MWSCKATSEAFGLFSNRLAVALARSQDHRASCGVFAFGPDRQGALANGLHGLNPRNTAHRYTPVQKATSVDLATGEAHSISGGKLGCVYKRTNPSSALGAIVVKDVWRSLEKVVLSTLGITMSKGKHEH